MIIFIGLALLIVGGISIALLAKDDEKIAMGVGVLMSGAILLVIFLFVGMIVYFDSISRQSNIVSYAEANRFVLDEATDTLRSGVPLHSLEIEGAPVSPGLFDAANLQQIEAFGKTVQQESLANTKYNREIAGQRRWEKNIFFGVFIPNLDEKYVFISP